MKMVEDAKTRRTQQIFTTVIVLLLLIAVFAYWGRPDAFDYQGSVSAAQNKVKSMKRNPRRFVPPAAIKEGDNEAVEAREVNRRIADSVLQEHTLFHSFFPEAWENSESWKAKEVPPDDDRLNTFLIDFQARLVDELKALKDTLGPRLKPDALKAVDEAKDKQKLLDKVGKAKVTGKPKDKDKEKALRAAKMRILRDHQKTYWIVEAICRIAADDAKGHLPLRIESVSMPARVKEGKDSTLVYSQPLKERRKTRNGPYGAFEVTISVLIDQRDIPRFLSAMRKGLPRIDPEDDPANARGSRHLMLIVRNESYRFLPAKDVIQYFKDTGAADEFNALGIDDLEFPEGEEDDVDEEKGGKDKDGEEDEDEDEKIVKPAHIIRILRGDIKIKPESPAKRKGIETFVNEFRYPGLLTITFVVPDYNRDYKLGVGPKPPKKSGRR